MSSVDITFGGILSIPILISEKKYRFIGDLLPFVSLRSSALQFNSLNSAESPICSRVYSDGQS